MLALILFQSVFFKNDAVIFSEDYGGGIIQNFQTGETGETNSNTDEQQLSDYSAGQSAGKYITYNSVKYQPDKFFILVIISHICVFLLPAVFYIKLKGSGYTKKLKLSLPNPKYISLAVYMFFALIAGVILINSFIYYLSGFKVEIAGTLIDTGGNPVYTAGVLISFVFLPAVCEEFLFRAVLSAEYEKYGAACAAVITSLAFAMSHFSLILFPSYLFAAIIFYSLAKVTNCVTFPVILHAGYNFYNIYVWDKLSGVLKFEQNRFIFIFLTAVIFMIFIYFVFGRLENIYYNMAYRVKNTGNLKNLKDIDTDADVKDENFFIKILRSVVSPTFIGAIAIYFIYISYINAG